MTAKFHVKVEWKPRPAGDKYVNFYGQCKVLANTVLSDLDKEEAEEIAAIYKNHPFCKGVSIERKKIPLDDSHIQGDLGLTKRGGFPT